MSFVDKVKGTTAKSYEALARRIRIRNTPEHTKQLLDDSIQNMDRELNREGHTGKLGTSDGLIHIKPFLYRGYLCTIIQFPGEGFKPAAICLTERAGLIGTGFDSFELVMFKTEHIAGQTLKLMIDQRLGNN